MGTGDEVTATAGSRLSDDGLHPDYWIEGEVQRRGHGGTTFAYRSPYRGTIAPGSFYERLAKAVQRGEWAPPPETVTACSLWELLAAGLSKETLPAGYFTLPELPSAADGGPDREALLRLATLASPAQTGTCT